jgi:hypothetical protein
LSTPAKISPRTITTTPSTREMITRCSASARPAEPATTPVVTKITANPNTNNEAPASIRPRRPVPSTTSAAPSPVAYER